jgi:Phytanoyl-CoA dioxygenase (PhyH)
VQDQRAVPQVLTSNGLPVSSNPSRFAPMRDSSDALGDPAELRRRFGADGYVLLRSVLDRCRVLDLRVQYFAAFDPALLAPGTTPEAGVFSGTIPRGLPDYGTAGHPAYDLVRSPEFDAFTSDPALREVAAGLLGGEVELLPRRILRHFDRLSGKASRAHVDYDYMNRGTDQVVTVWIPIGDCPIECGGLVYLEGSHRVSRDHFDALRQHTDRPDDRRPISNDLERTAEVLGGRWLWTDYRAGDVALHSPHMVHASLDDRSDVMRLSADIRFRRADARPDERWSRAWSADDGF